MIVLRGLGRGEYPGSLVAFGLTRQVDIVIPPTPSDPKGGKRRRYIFADNALAAFSNFLDENELLLPTEVLVEAEQALEAAKTVLEAPVTVTLGEGSWKAPYAALRADFVALKRSVTKTTLPKAVEPQFKAVIDRVLTQINREEEEIALLIALEEL